MSTSVRDRLVGGAESVGERLRARRWQMLLGEFADVADYKVLDLGGTARYWQRAPVQPLRVDVVNLAPDPDAGDLSSSIRVFEGNACDLPEELTGEEYDLVVSNSVIEHVGGHAQRIAFAETVRERSHRHWVQTPYRYFPVEPHYLFPGAQFLPLRARAWLAQRWPLSHAPGGDSASAIADAQWIDSLDATQMRHYFPDSSIRFERVLGCPKSIIAIRS